MKYILVVGGAGYIGAHMARMLLDKKHNIIVLDNLSTGNRTFVPKEAVFIPGDLRKPPDIEKAFKKYKIDTVMHFAASISVPESVRDPLKYYENNVLGCINLLKIMRFYGVEKFIFSSTAAVYGEPRKIPIGENDLTSPTNPYGESKLMIEKILRDLSQSSGFRYVSLRYFNAAGCHPSGELGPWHPQVTNLIPVIMRVIKGKQKELLIYGDDYPTPDGTCLRDYIHVLDLCRAHLLAYQQLNQGMKSNVFNLGSGKGYSVKEVIRKAELITKKDIPRRIFARRPGDPSKLIASYKKAKQILNWEPKLTLEDMVRSMWKYEQGGLHRNGSPGKIRK